MQQVRTAKVRRPEVSPPRFALLRFQLLRFAWRRFGTNLGFSSRHAFQAVTPLYKLGDVVWVGHVSKIVA